MTTNVGILSQSFRNYEYCQSTKNAAGNESFGDVMNKNISDSGKADIFTKSASAASEAQNAAKTFEDAVIRLQSKANEDVISIYNELISNFPDIKFQLDDNTNNPYSSGKLGYDGNLHRTANYEGSDGIHISIDVSVLKAIQNNPSKSRQVLGSVYCFRQEYSIHQKEAK